MNNKILFFGLAAALALLASSCRPDLAISHAVANWDNGQQSASFVLVNNGSKAAAPFELQIMLLDETDAVVEVAYQQVINGLRSGEQLEWQNLSLRHLLTAGDQRLRQATQAVFIVDPQNVVHELEEANNHRSVALPAIHTPCDAMVRFEDLPSGTEFTSISHIASDGMGFAISALSGNEGFATVRTGLAFGHGQLLRLNNVWLEPKLCSPRHYIAFDAGYSGGGIYLEVNGDRGDSPYPNISAIDGVLIGGVLVSVSGSTDNPGVWYFNGDIGSLKIGGAKLAIDNMIFWTRKIKIIS